MLKKAHIFGLLAVGLAIAPSAAFAGDQVQGSSTSTVQTSITTGNNNVTGQSSTIKTVQSQVQKGNPLCNSGNQIQAAAVNTSQAGLTTGLYNVTANSSSTDTYQRQIAKVQGYFCK